MRLTERNILAEIHLDALQVGWVLVAYYSTFGSQVSHLLLCVLGVCSGGVLFDLGSHLTFLCSLSYSHARVRSRTHAHGRAYTHARTHALTHSRTHARIRTHSHALARTRTHSHALTRSNTHTHTHVRVHARSSSYSVPSRHHLRSSPRATAPSYVRW